jgi:SAM-dependent methyltransferase
VTATDDPVDEERTETSPAFVLPQDYYRRIYDVEERHWWHVGMRRITAALLADVLAWHERPILDAGCGTGGFLRWLCDLGSANLVGIDISETAIELAKRRVPEAELRVAPVHELPFADSTFSLAFLNDVLQHVPEEDVAASLAEVRRVLKDEGHLLVRTNGARRSRRERRDWRVYDRESLMRVLAEAGFRCERITHANMALSLAASLHNGTPSAPSEASHGIPKPQRRLRNAIGLRLLKVEAAYLARTRRALPYGHTLFVHAVRNG